jgi:hypothetical protein
MPSGSGRQAAGLMRGTGLDSHGGPHWYLNFYAPALASGHAFIDLVPGPTPTVAAATLATPRSVPQAPPAHQQPPSPPLLLGVVLVPSPISS